MSFSLMLLPEYLNNNDKETDITYANKMVFFFLRGGNIQKVI